MTILFAFVWAAVLLFAWSLCRVAAKPTPQIGGRNDH